MRGWERMGGAGGAARGLPAGAAALAPSGPRAPTPAPDPARRADAGSHRLSAGLDLLLPGQINYPAEKSLNPTIKPV